MYLYPSWLERNQKKGSIMYRRIMMWILADFIPETKETRTQSAGRKEKKRKKASIWLLSSVKVSLKKWRQAAVYSHWMFIIRKTETMSVGEDVKHLEASYIVGGNVKWSASLAVPLKVKYRFAISSVSPVAQSCPTLCDPTDHSMPDLPVHHQVYSNSCPLSRWCHPTISSSVVPFSSHLQSFPAAGSF